MLAIIPARAGSKGFPGKNIYPTKGHPLLAWTIESARKSNSFDRIVVSTDGEDIANVARDYGAEVLIRPDHLAGDTSTPKDVVIDILKTYSGEGYVPEVAVLLQPTSPLRLAEDIVNCIKIFHKKGIDTTASFSIASPHPMRAFVLKNQIAISAHGDDSVWKRRQDWEPQYHLNGAVYVIGTQAFLENTGSGFLYGNIGAYIMPQERSLDIDTYAELMMAIPLMNDCDTPEKTNL